MNNFKSNKEITKMMNDNSKSRHFCGNNLIIRVYQDGSSKFAVRVRRNGKEVNSELGYCPTKVNQKLGHKVISIEDAKTACIKKNNAVSKGTIKATKAPKKAARKATTLKMSHAELVKQVQGALKKMKGKALNQLEAALMNFVKATNTGAKKLKKAVKAK